MLDLGSIASDIGVDDSTLARLAGLRVAVLHADDTSIALGFQVPENVRIVDLSRGRFVAARIIAHLDIGDLVPRFVDIRNEIAFGNLLILEI